MPRKRYLKDMFMVDNDAELHTDDDDLMASKPMKRARFNPISFEIMIKIGNISQQIELHCISPNYTIQKLSNTLCMHQRIDISSINIIYPFQFHSSMQTLKDCGIYNGCSLTVIFKFIHAHHLFNYISSIQSMVIFIKTSSGNSIWFGCKPQDKVYKIKTYIHELEGVPKQQQQLLFNGQHLDDNSTLNDCNVYHLNSIDLVLCK
eukprot:659015_1